MPKHQRLWLIATAALIAAVTILVHWPAVHNGFVNWDDPFYLERVSELKRVSPASLEWVFTALPVYYQPLTWLSHLIDFQIWGWDLAGHHATSIVLHGINAALVFLFLWMLTGAIEDLSPSTRLMVSAGVAVVFGIHPLQVESVAWIAERKTLLCTLFSLLSLCAYLRAVSRQNGRGWWWGLVVLFVAAWLSKPMAVSLPLVMLSLDFYPLRRQRQRHWRQLIQEKWLLFLFCLAAGIVTIVAQSHTGALTGLVGFGIWDRCLVAARNVAFYVWKLIWPAWLSPYYPLEGEISSGDLEFWGSLVGVVLVTALAFGRRHRLPAVWSAWSAYLALILPVSGLLQAGPQGAGDRFMYFAMVPLLALAAAGSVWFWQRSPLVLRSALTTVLGCLVLFYGMRTHDQIPVWRDDVTLWMTAAIYFPESALTNWKLAIALTDQQRYEAALVYAQKALRLNPTFGPAHAELGDIYLKMHRYQDAVKESQEALRLKPDQPNGQYVLACAYARLGRLKQSFELLQRLLVTNPEFAAWAARDEDLAVLRKQPEYAARFATLIATAKN
ncbi:MAG TPA: tetratricopeptide repeat protein [Verrucomicrobiae bacterium]|nr:tetratricopeptide repeat protein [Verrucomicrobiae bacterium]